MSKIPKCCVKSDFNFKTISYKQPIDNPISL